jgi:hypothetical protein
MLKSAFFRRHRLAKGESDDWRTWVEVLRWAQMRFPVRMFLLTVLLTLGVQQGGSPNSDTLAQELTTGVVMTDEGPVIVPVFVSAKTRHKCLLPTISRPGASEKELIAAVVNRAAECAILEAVTKSDHAGRDVH